MFFCALSVSERMERKGFPMQNYMDELVRLMKSDLPDAQIAEAL